jgi:hypothetical protein
MDRRAQAILRLDGGAGFCVGVAVLLLHDWVGQLHALPPSLVFFLGAANLAYGSYSGTLAIRAAVGKATPRAAIDLLIAANALWSVVCAALLVMTHRSASPFGVAHIAIEGLFVAALAVAERRWVRPATMPS